MKIKICTILFALLITLILAGYMTKKQQAKLGDHA